MTFTTKDKNLPAMYTRIANYNKWLEIRKTPDGYTYSHETHCDGLKLAVLIFNDDNMAFARHEWTPCHGAGLQVCSITGSVEQGDPVGTAIKEIKEEAGIDAKPDELIFLGTSRPYKATDAQYFLYALNATDKEEGEIKGDGSPGEKDSYCEWMPMERYLLCKDPLVAQMFVRLKTGYEEGSHE